MQARLLTWSVQGLGFGGAGCRLCLRLPCCEQAGSTEEDFHKRAVMGVQPFVAKAQDKALQLSSRPARGFTSYLGMERQISPLATGKGTLSGMAAIVLWSASVGLIRSISELLGKTGGAAVIFTLAGVLASVAVRGTRPWRLNRIYLFGGGLLFISYEILLAISIGLASNRSQALELGMINYMWPSLTIVLAVLTRQQRGSLLLVPGLVLSLLGLVFAVKGDGSWSLFSLASGISDNPLAYGFAGVAAILWAMYTVLTKRFGGGGNATPLFLLVTAVVLWVLYAVGNEPAIHLGFYGGAQAFVLGVFMSAAYSFWNFGIQRGNLAVLATASYLTPVLSILLASLWLDTPPTRGFWYGVFLVTAGSLVCWRSTLQGHPKAGT